MPVRVRWGFWICWFTVLLTTGCGAKKPIHYELKISEKVQGVYHVVEAKQTFWRICKAYGVDMQQVAEINDIHDVTLIETGQRIFIPGAAKPLKVEPYRPLPLEKEEPEPKVEKFQGRFIWPVKGKITSRYGVRNGVKHSGIDISAPSKTPVTASSAGEVAYRGTLRGYGNILILRHSEVYTTVYAHLASSRVRKGQYVRQGQVIATVGSTGRSTGYHLHFEVRVGNKARNPLFFLPKLT